MQAEAGSRHHETRTTEYLGPENAPVSDLIVSLPLPLPSPAPEYLCPVLGPSSAPGTGLLRYDFGGQTHRFSGRPFDNLS
jgi:hypothetical protein